MRRSIALLVLLVLAGAAAAVVITTRGRSKSGSAAPAAGLRTLQTTHFSASYPASFSDSVRTARAGSSQHRLSSTGAAISRLGIPPPGAVGITVGDTPASGVVAGHYVSEVGVRATDLVLRNVGVPRGATGVVLAAPPRTVTLGGVEAAEEGYTYRLGDRQIVQADVVAQHDGRVAFVELDVEPGLASQGQVALQDLTSSWRWS